MTEASFKYATSGEPTMIRTQFTTREVGVAVLLVTFLLGTAGARADQEVDPSLKKPAQALSQMDDTPPATKAPSPDRAVADTEVGDAASNVDKDSSSGEYYPYSAGTVGDDPAHPKSTAVSTDGSNSDSGPTDQWGETADSDGDGYLSLAELTEAAPALVASFDAMDVDGDDKLTRGEFRSWHESHKARADTDDSASKSTATTPPDVGGN